MNQTVPKSAFKPKALEYLRRVGETGEELVITDKGQPVIRIVPFRARARRSAASLRGSVRRYERPLDPVADGDWLNASPASASRQARTAWCCAPSS